MKIKLSKNQWEIIGKKAGWKVSQTHPGMDEIDPKKLGNVNSYQRSEDDVFDEIYKILTQGGTYQTFSQLINHFEEIDKEVAEKVLNDELRSGGLLRADNAGIIHAIAKNKMKIKLSKKHKVAQIHPGSSPLSIRTIESYERLCNQWIAEGKDMIGTTNIVQMLDRIKKTIAEENISLDIDDERQNSMADAKSSYVPKQNFEDEGPLTDYMGRK